MSLGRDGAGSPLTRETGSVVGLLFPLRGPTCAINKNATSDRHHHLGYLGKEITQWLGRSEELTSRGGKEVNQVEKGEVQLNL